uniref:Retrotransposon gag domain-containing protein n=1 Tax=Phytophthora ramorum TaxID=164328 RepID=H3GFB4_PHYRM
MKKLDIEDFKGMPSESIEAWLSTVQQAVQRQEMLGGDSWNAVELFYGVTAHLKGDANKWFMTMSDSMDDDDCTFTYLTRKLRKKYGRRENSWQIQKRLGKREQQSGERLDAFAGSLTSIGFGKRVSAESYLEAFYDGLNNQDAAAHIRTLAPQNLGEALEYAIDGYGEYGEGRKITSWRSAKQRYRLGGEGENGSNKPAATGMSVKTDPVEEINWKQLGLGFGGSDTPPKYDDAGKAVSRMAGASSTNEGALSLTALQAIAVAAGKSTPKSMPRQQLQFPKPPPASSRTMMATVAPDEVAATMEATAAEDKAGTAVAMAVADEAAMADAVLEETAMGVERIAAKLGTGGENAHCGSKPRQSQ